MKSKAEYDTTPANFAYCATHNRVYVHQLSLWLTPVRPQDLTTFQAICDECRKTSAYESERLMSMTRCLGS